MEWSASRPCHFTLSERAPGTHWVGGWVWMLWRKEKFDFPSGTWTSAIQLVTHRYIDRAILFPIADVNTRGNTRVIELCLSLRVTEMLIDRHVRNLPWARRTSFCINSPLIYKKLHLVNGSVLIVVQIIFANTQKAIVQSYNTLACGNRKAGYELSVRNFVDTLIKWFWVGEVPCWHDCSVASGRCSCSLKVRWRFIGCIGHRLRICNASLH
jgi:hypothetical protein